ncbi:MAG: hypothetical protein LIP01_10420 [Tannerellaceae bacterium]|nr:hypothetical protein [Tannerellaceae bacterium]
MKKNSNQTGRVQTLECKIFSIFIRLYKKGVNHEKIQRKDKKRNLLFPEKIIGRAGTGLDTERKKLFFVTRQNKEKD